MGKFSQNTERYSGKKKPQAGVTAALALLVVALAAVLAGLLLRGSFPTGEAAADTPAIPSVPPETAAMQVPEKVSFQPTANGNSTSVLCRASYTGSNAAADTVAARAGDASLTVRELQLLYLSQVNAQRNAQEQPDYSQPLDTQRCPLAENLSWQQYFLQRAILSWQAQQALLYAAAQPQRITEEAFQPDSTDTLHEKYIAPELPVNHFLYQEHDRFIPNSLHQAYLDGMEETLDALAQRCGYGSLSEMAARTGIPADQWVQAAVDYNTAYMYFTEESYDIEPTDEALASYLHSPEAVIPTDGGETVNIRQVLFVPKGADVAEDGTVTATQAQWDEALSRANAFLENWEKECGSRYSRSQEAVFAQLASQQSEDNGSKIDGGYYHAIEKGQLIAALDEWCFADGRHEMESAVLKSELGYHVVLLTAFMDSGLEEARDNLRCSLQQTSWENWLKKVPLKADYSQISLWVDTTNVLPTLEDTLYPDIAHQRFPEVMVYLQQDYYTFPFGDRSIGPNGCGITNFAMLATYMTDSLQTPAMMAKRFDDDFFDYATHATDGSIFHYAPAEMGFYTDKMVFSIDDVIPEVQQGKLVVSLQHKGHFTSSGHYLIITGYNAAEDTFQVRDSNVFNYGKLSGHKTDWFERYTLLSGGGNYYVMQPKVTAIPACARCGGSFESRQPARLLQADYTCEKCGAALSRRNHFLSILNAFSDNSI